MLDVADADPADSEDIFGYGADLDGMADGARDGQFFVPRRHRGVGE